MFVDEECSKRPRSLKCDFENGIYPLERILDRRILWVDYDSDFFGIKLESKENNGNEAYPEEWLRLVLRNFKVLPWIKFSGFYLPSIRSATLHRNYSLFNVSNGSFVEVNGNSLDWNSEEYMGDAWVLSESELYLPKKVGV